MAWRTGGAACILGLVLTSLSCPERALCSPQIHSSSQRQTVPSELRTYSVPSDTQIHRAASPVTRLASTPLDPPTTPSPPVELILLKPNQTRGRCLDGSQPGYYLRRGYGTGKQRWMIVLEGGGWCFSYRQCVTRSRGPLGSSISWSTNATGPEVGFHGAASGNASVNPDFYNWNLAVIKYCDGGSFGASMGQAQPPKGETKALFFLGHWNLQGSLADLVLRQGLAEGKAALVGGCSAGGQTVSMACDAIAKYLRAYGVPTKCFMDAGYFPDAVDLQGNRSFQAKVKGLYDTQKLGVPAGPQTACQAYYSKERETWKCFFPQYNLIFLRSAMFIINSLRDYKSIALTYASRTGPKGAVLYTCLGAKSAKRCSQAGTGMLDQYAEMVRVSLDHTQKRQQEARGESLSFQSFLIPQPVHCVLGSNSWHNIVSPYSGLDLRTAFRNWYFKSPTTE